MSTLEKQSRIARYAIAMIMMAIATALIAAVVEVSTWWTGEVVYGRMKAAWLVLQERHTRNGTYPETGHEDEGGIVAGVVVRDSWRSSIESDVLAILGENSKKLSDEDEIAACVFAPRGGPKATIFAVCSQNGGWLADEVLSTTRVSSQDANPALLIECPSLHTGCHAIADVRSTINGLTVVINGKPRGTHITIGQARIVRVSGFIEPVPNDLSNEDLHAFLCGRSQ
jgi:hypothetical protein